MKDDVIFDRNGRPVQVKRIPARGKAKSLFKGKNYDNSLSPFERFKNSNHTGSKITSM